MAYDDLEQFKQILSVRHWLIFTDFGREETGHADIHERVLKPNLFAVAWNPSSKKDRAVSR